MAKYWIFRVAALLVPRVPMWLARPVALAVGALLYALAGTTRRRVERNLRHIPALAQQPQRLQQATRGVFQHMALNYVDFFRGAHISDADLLAGWTIENQQVLDDAVAQGRGVVIVGAHFGNFEFSASRLGAIGHHLLAPAERMRPEPLFELFVRLRQHHNLRLVPADSRDALRAIPEALKRGEVVVFVADRYIVGASAELPLFDAPAKMPIGPFTLAARSGAPVLSAHAWREGPGRSHGIFLPLRMDPPPVTSRSATRTADEALAMLRTFIGHIEMVVGAHPEQWVSALSPIWDAGQLPGPSASESAQRAPQPTAATTSSAI